MADTPNEKNDSQIPPKLNLKPNGATPEAPSAADKNKPEDVELEGGGETIHIKMPNESDEASSQPKRLSIRPETVKTVKITPKDKSTEPAPTQESEEKPEEPAAAERKKSQTSKIPLGEASNEPGEGKGRQTNAPKTIRIRPITKQFKAPPGTDSAVGPTSQTASLDEKRKTSRISLDSVFEADTAKKKAEAKDEAAAKPPSGSPPPATAKTPADEQSADDPTRPKTIRLKRPGEAATIKMTRPAGASKPEEKADSEAPTILSKTSRLDLPEDETPESSPTRRKTIRVKRPTGSRGVKPEASAATIKRTESPVQAPRAAEEQGILSLQPEEDRLGVGFLVASIAALLAVGVMLYMMLAQTTGPNVCWTETSIWNGPFGHLPWPGKYIPSASN